MERGETYRVEASGDKKTVLAQLRERGVYLDAPCGGRGTCGRCRVLFPENAPVPTPKERRLLTAGELAKGVRLACAAVPGADCAVILPREVQAGIATPGSGAEQLMSGREAGCVEAECEAGAAAGEQGAGAEQLMSGREAGCALAGCGAEREDGVVWGKRGLEPECEDGRRLERPGSAGEKTGGSGPARGAGESRGGYGIAIDIGTTTLAAALVRPDTGEIAAVRTAVNRQRAYGADVISRIQAANEGKGEALREQIRADLRLLTEALSAQAGVPPAMIEEIAIAGNTVMCHLLRGLSVRSLGEAPFTPEDVSLWEGDGGALSGWDAIGARAVILPGISAFVGADIVAGIYGCGMHRRTEAAFFLDIGTNGEMVVGNREGFLVTSAAAGPVFEGGNLAYGVAGIPGAIAHVELHTPQERQCVAKGIPGVCYKTIGGCAPVGLCGTGVIDLVSELVRLGLVDGNGALAEPWCETGFPVAEGVFLTQRDIREIQMGKSAIRAGIETLLGAYGGEAGEVFLAGGFGYEMDVAKAARIGLFPEWLKDRVRLLGNSSLNGAVRFLCERGGREETEWIASHAREINLAMDPGFQDLYLQSMFFEDL